MISVRAAEYGSTSMATQRIFVADCGWVGVEIALNSTHLRKVVVRGGASLRDALMVARDAAEEVQAVGVCKAAAQILAPIVGADGVDLLWSLDAFVPEAEVELVLYPHHDPLWWPDLELACAREAWLEASDTLDHPNDVAMVAGAKAKDKFRATGIAGTAIGWHNHKRIWIEFHTEGQPVRQVSFPA